MSDYTQGQVFSIAYNVWISGTRLKMEKKQCIQSIEIVETVEGADTAKIVISDPEFLFIEDNIFVEENTVKIMLGWDNTTYRVTFNGYISAIDIDFPSDGIPVVTVNCLDNTHVMNRAKKDKTFNNMTSADVVKQICAQYGYSCVVESGYTFAKQETITQSNQTDIDFITKLAGDEVHPFTARLVGNTFYYVKKGKLETPVMTLTYKKYPHTVVSFSPKINKETRKEEIKSSKVTTTDKSVSTTKLTRKTNKGSATASGGKTADETQSINPNKSTGRSTSKTTKSHTYNPATKSWK